AEVGEQRPHVALLDAEPHPGPVGARARLAAEDEVDEDRRQVQPGGDREADRAVDARVEIDRVGGAGGTDQLQLEDPAQPEPSEDLRDAALDRLVAHDRLRERARTAARRMDPPRDLVTRADELAAPRDPGDGDQLAGEERLHEPPPFRTLAEQGVELVERVDPYRRRLV